MQVRASSAGELEKVARLLQESFHVSAQDPSVDPRFLAWKYYEEGPRWPGSRSFILEEKGEIVAEAAIWPVQIRLARGLREGISFGDWAASEKHRGAGLLLLKKLKELSSFVLVSGGAQITRDILPRMGFQPWADRARYARVLRPFRQAAARTTRLGLKEPIRVLRNVVWSAKPLVSAAEWTADETAPDERVVEISHRRTGSVHTVDYLQFLLRCPTVKLRFVALRRRGLAEGYAVLSEVGGQVRLGEFRVASEDQQEWNAALGALVRFVRRQTDACELVAAGSVSILNKALAANGFVVRGSVPLVVFDSAGRMFEEPLVQLGLLEDDACVLPGSDFLT